jgi:hypothetical protein
MKRLGLIAVAALLAGCTVGPPPTDNNEYFAVAQSNPFGSAKAFTTERSLSSIGRSFEQNGPRCLNTSVRTRGTATFGGIPALQENVSTYRAEVVRRDGGVTLNIYSDISTNVANRADGFVRTIMVDARAVSGGTEVRIAGPRLNFEDVLNAVEEWARGQSSRCPEFTL